MTAYFDPDTCDIDDFTAHLDQTQAELRFTRTVTSNIPIYDAGDLVDTFAGVRRQDLLAEWAGVLRTGAGVLVIRNAYADTGPIDAATEIYRDLIAREKAAGLGEADHFATAGSNDRLWNALQKLCLAAPRVFAAYFGNVAVAAASEAWLGPNYQMTAQINLVHPGGKAQQAHRDYHLGFQTGEISAAYPAHVHDLSPVLTLQGAIAHCDMPVASGPTKLLPFSQSYRPGYAAWRLPTFRAYFEDHHVQLPLAKGDALFFNPALFHAAGANTTTDIERMANLLQVSSAFGRALENIDRTAISKALYPVLLADPLPADRQAAAVAACAEGYPFPTNLDTDPPVGGLAPESQQAFMLRALADNLPAADFNAGLDRMDGKKRP